VIEVQIVTARPSSTALKVAFRNGSRDFVAFLARAERPKLPLFGRDSASSAISA